MSLPRQAVHPGTLEKAYRREVEYLATGNIVRRLWAKDPSLWPADDAHLKSLSANLGWLDLPERLGPYMTKVAEFATALESEGFEDVVFVSFGDSSLAAETVSQLSLPKRWKRLFVLDSTDPATVRALDKELNLERTLFIFASKSGKRIENQALLLYFLEQFRLRGIEEPGRHFVAVTQEHAYLAEIAKAYKFRAIFFDPPGISGRYSALIHFGLLLSGLCRLTPASLLFSAASMNEVCRHGDLKESNPALALASFLAAGAKTGNDRLLLFGTSSLAALTHRVAHLVGVSTGKGSKGLVPITAEFPAPIEAYQRNCLASIFILRGDEDSALRKISRSLMEAGVPTALLELDTPEEFAAELFKWELATALASALLNVNPFDEPDLRESANAAAELLEILARKSELPPRTVRIREAGIELYAEGNTRQEISTLNLPEALRTFFETRNPEGYFATLAFMDRGSGPLAALRRIGEQVADRLKIPALLSFGPRYLHHLAQVFQGGPAKGLFLMLTGQPTQDVVIPGAGYSFGQLQLALAMGDFDTLARHQKPVLRLHLAEGVERGLPQLEQVIQRSLKHIRER